MRLDGAVKVGTSSFGNDRTLLPILHSVITRQQEGKQLPMNCVHCRSILFDDANLLLLKNKDRRGNFAV